MRKLYIILFSAISLNVFTPLRAQSIGDVLLSGIGTGKSNLTSEARVCLKMGDVDKALVAYSQAVEQKQIQRNGGKGVKGDLLAEYAYTLALRHDFEAALVNIDRARMLGTEYDDFYAAQILTLMDYTDAAQQLMRFVKAPDWINGIYQGLNEKYKTTASINRDAPETALKRANKLAATKQTIQAMALFEELARIYPESYIIYIDYSTVWESMGYYAYAAQLLQKGIGLMPDDQTENKQIFQNHLTMVTDKSLRHENAPWVKKFFGLDQLKLMTYAGASIAKDSYMFNGRLGVYTSEKFSASLNLGMGYVGEFSGNIGLSAYKTWGVFVGGMGFTGMFSKSSNSFNYTLSAGLSFLNKKQTSSFDIMVNGNFPFTKGSNVSYSISIGKTIYFDLNKLMK